MDDNRTRTTDRSATATMHPPEPASSMELKLGPGRAGEGDAHGEVEVSFVMPCLNEAETLAGCIDMARRCIAEHGLRAEIVVGDNGSTDGSQEIARRHGARVVPIARRGYGAALQGAIAAARGRYVIMGDSDMSYDFTHGHRFVAKLREGYDVVMGTRLKGEIKPGAMPWKHQFIGNPAITAIARTWFHCPVTDMYCGLRAFTKAGYEKLDMQSTGMVFAIEHVIKSTRRGLRITEIPITLHPDGRSRPPHLRTWRDGWRTLKFMMLLSPRWTLFLPGVLLLLLGLVLGGIVAAGPVQVSGVTLDVHTLIVASLFAVVGYQFITLAAAMRSQAVDYMMGPPGGLAQRLLALYTFERGIIGGVVLLGLGLAAIAWLTVDWIRSGFGPMDEGTTLRWIVLGCTLATLGAQTLMMSIVYSMLETNRPART